MIIKGLKELQFPIIQKYNVSGKPIETSVA